MPTPSPVRALSAALSRLVELRPLAVAAAERARRYRDRAADVQGQCALPFADAAWMAGLQRQTAELQAGQPQHEADIGIIEQWSATTSIIRDLSPAVARAAEDRGIDSAPLLAFARDLGVQHQAAARDVVARVAVLGIPRTAQGETPASPPRGKPRRKSGPKSKYPKSVAYAIRQRLRKDAPTVRDLYDVCRTKYPEELTARNRLEEAAECEAWGSAIRRTERQITENAQNSGSE